MMEGRSVYVYVSPIGDTSIGSSGIGSSADHGRPGGPTVGHVSHCGGGDRMEIGKDLRVGVREDRKR